MKLPESVNIPPDAEYTVSIKKSIRTGRLLMKKITGIAGSVLFCGLCFLCCMRAAVFVPFVKNALHICVTVLIPSLFPFLFITQITARTGLAEAAGNTLSFVLSPLFGVPPSLCGALLTGFFGGFPNGATAAGIAYESGRCTKQAAERVAALADNVSPAFLIGVAGTYALGSPKAGFILLAALGLTVVTNAFLLRFCYPLDKTEDVPLLTTPPQTLAASFCKSVQAAVTGMLAICGYVTLFTVLSGVLCRILPCNALQAFGIRAFSELSAAVLSLVTAEFPLSFLLCAAASGFSGLCVLAQVSDVCGKYGLSVRPFLFTRMTGAVLFPLYTIVLLLLLPREAIAVFSYAVTPLFTDASRLYGIIAVYVLFGFTAIGALLCLQGVFTLYERIRKKNVKSEKKHEKIQNTP